MREMQFQLLYRKLNAVYIYVTTLFYTFQQTRKFQFFFLYMRIYCILRKMSFSLLF